MVQVSKGPNKGTKQKTPILHMQYLQQIILTPTLDVVTLTKKYLKEQFDKSNCYRDAGSHQIRLQVLDITMNGIHILVNGIHIPNYISMKVESIKEISQVKANKETEHDIS